MEALHFRATFSFPQGHQVVHFTDALIIHGERQEEIQAWYQRFQEQVYFHPGSHPKKLEELSPRQSQVVECLFFAGLNIPETAEALDISPATVKRDWAAARAWLYREMQDEDRPDESS